MIKKLVVQSLAIGTFALSHALGGISFDLQAEKLKKADGTWAPQSTLALLVASTTDSVFSPVLPGVSLTVGSFLDGGDDRILYKADLSTFGFGVLGILFEFPSVFLTGNFNTGDPLALYWFPELTLSSTTTSVGNTYGVFSGPALDSSDPWITPNDGNSSHSLYFFTTDAEINPGSHNPNLGKAIYTVIPEPVAVSLVLSGLGLLIGCRRRR